MRRLCLVLLSIGLAISPATAAVVPNSPVFPQTPHTYSQRFVTADPAGTYKTLVTGNTTGNNAGTRCTAIWVTSDDTTAAHLLTFRFTRIAAAGTYPGPTLTTNTTQVPQSVLNATTWPGAPQDSDGNVQIFLNAGDLLEVTYATAITAAKIIGIHAECWDF